MRLMMFAIPLSLAICVSTCFAQDTQAEADSEDFTKAAKMLHGVWAGDAEKTAEEIEKMEDLDMPEGMLEMVLDQVGQIKIHFHDETFTVEIGGQEMEGEWKVTGAEKKEDLQTVTIRVTPTEDQEKNFEIHILGKKHMKMIDLDDNGPPIVMARKEKEDKDD